MGSLWTLSKHHQLTQMFFDNKVARENLHVQAAMYFDLGIALHKYLKDFSFPMPTGFVHAAFEFQSPYNWQAVNMVAEMMGYGREIYQEGVMSLIRSHKENKWGPYHSGVRDYVVPNWYRWKMGERDQKKLDEAFEQGLDNVAI
jgi:hypothetical protein